MRKQHNRTAGAVNSLKSGANKVGSTCGFRHCEDNIFIFDSSTQTHKSDARAKDSEFNGKRSKCGNCYFLTIFDENPAKVHCKDGLANMRAHGVPRCIKTALKSAKITYYLALSAQV